MICEEQTSERSSWQPFILGLGGTTRPGSSSERALRLALRGAAAAGASTELVPASGLELPPYAPERGSIDPRAEDLVELVARCDGLLIATPGFHGGPSGLIKNALDYIEELRTNDPPYLDGRAVGGIVCAAGWQATGSTLAALRSTVHALRGWPTPLGVGINSAVSDEPGADPIESAAPQLEILAGQVVEFARWRRASLRDPSERVKSREAA